MSRSVHSVKLNPYHSSQLSSLSYTLGDVVFDQDNQTLRVMDGASYGGNILANQAWTQGYINTVFSQAVITVGNTSNTDGTYPSGALRIAGGLSVKKDTYMDGSLTVNTNLTVTGDLNATVKTSSQTNITTLGTLTGLTSQGAVVITSNTATTVLGTGALQVSGGASIAGNLYVGGTLNLAGSQLDIDSATFSNGVTVSGSTTPATEYFTITDGAATPTTTFRVDTANGNLVTSGSITASSFTGGVATISDTAPTVTSAGSLWFSSVTGGLYLKYTSGEWVQVYSPGGSASSGVSSYNLPTATPRTLGGIKVDNTTITITPDGIISAVQQTIPTNNNQLTNGAGYITSSSLPTAVSQLANDSAYITSSALTSYAPKINPTFSGSISVSKSVTAYTIGEYSSYFSNSQTVQNADGGMKWKPDGTQFTFVSSINNTIVTVSCSSPWNLLTAGTATTVSLSSYFSGGISDGHHWKSDGTEFYVIAVVSASRYLARVSVSTPWDITTISGVTRNSVALTGTPTAISFSSNGIRFYTITGTTLRDYNLSVAWNFAAADGAGNSQNLIGVLTNPGGFELTPDGTKIFIFNNTNKVSVFTVLTPYWAYTLDATTIQTFDFSSYITSATVGSFTWRSDGNYFYLASTNGSNTQFNGFYVGNSGGSIILPGTISTTGGMSSSGNVVVGGPDSTRQITGATRYITLVSTKPGFYGYGSLEIQGNYNGTGIIGNVNFITNGSTASSIISAARIEAQSGVNNTTNGQLIFYTNGNNINGTGTEALRIDENQTVIVKAISYTSGTSINPTGVVNFNYSIYAVWYVTSMSVSFTANITNVPTTNNRTLEVKFILVQGATAYVPSVLQIDGTNQTIKWLGSVTAPSGNINKLDIVTFTLIRTGSAWTVTGALVTYG